MILRARQDAGILILELEGQLDFETTNQFQETCETLIAKTQVHRIVFNMEKLKFVGSSGINQFIRALKELNSIEEKPKLCSLSPEFDRVFKAYQTTRNPFEIFTDEPAAIAAFSAPRPVKKAKAAKKPEAGKRAAKTPRGNA